MRGIVSGAQVSKSKGESLLARSGQRPLSLLAGWHAQDPRGANGPLREISAVLAEAGHTTKMGKPYAPTAIKLMLARGSGRVLNSAIQGDAQ